MRGVGYRRRVRQGRNTPYYDDQWYRMIRMINGTVVVDKKTKEIKVALSQWSKTVERRRTDRVTELSQLCVD